MATTTTLVRVSSTHYLHRHSLPTPHNATLPVPPRKPARRSPFAALGPDLFHLLLSHIAGESMDRPITTDAYRFILPFAVCCTSHYNLTIRAIHGLSLLPLNFTLDRSGHRRRPPSFPTALLLSPPTTRSPPLSLDRHLPRAIARLPELCVLHLFRNSQVCDAALSEIAHAAPNLRELRLRANRSLSVVGLRALQSCSRLAILDLSYCLGLSNECATLLASLPVLHTLLLAYWPISDAFIATLATSTTLRDLCLTACSTLTSTSCLHLANAGRLTALRFRSSPTLDDRAVSHLAQLPTLTTLDLALSRHISDSSLTALSNPEALPNLHRLTFSQCTNITDNGVIHLSQNHNVRVLDLSFCHHLTDMAVEALTRMLRLESLDIGGCRNVSDEAVRRLTRLPWLCRLGLSRCVALTDRTAEALVKAANAPLEFVDVRNCFAMSSEALEELNGACKQLLRSPER